MNSVNFALLPSGPHWQCLWHIGSGKSQNHSTICGSIQTEGRNCGSRILYDVCTQWRCLGRVRSCESLLSSLSICMLCLNRWSNVCVTNKHVTALSGTYSTEINSGTCSHAFQIFSQCKALTIDQCLYICRHRRLLWSAVETLSFTMHSTITWSTNVFSPRTWRMIWPWSPCLTSKASILITTPMEYVSLSLKFTVCDWKYTIVSQLQLFVCVCGFSFSFFMNVF